MKPPAILGLVSYKVFPAKMGGQKHIAGFYTALAAETKLVVAAARQNADSGEHPFPVSAFLYDHWKGLYNLVYLPRLSRLIRQQGIDLVLIEHSYFGFLGILLRRLTGKPYVIRSQNIEAHRFRDLRRSWWRLYERYEAWVHRRADHSFFITDEDRQWAVAHWGLLPAKCSVSSYGFNPVPATAAARAACRQTLLQQYALPVSTRLFLFNGTLNYLPNTDALRIILTELLPILRQQLPQFRIVVCGSALEPQWKKELDAQPEIICQGFVDDIVPWFMGCDCLINPITLGGGIRTKMIEALACNQTVVSTESSAHGMDRGLAGGKLLVVPDYDWQAFADAMAGDLQEQATVPELFHAVHNWGNIVRRALLSLQTL